MQITATEARVLSQGFNPASSIQGFSQPGSIPMGSVIRNFLRICPSICEQASFNIKHNVPYQIQMQMASMFPRLAPHHPGIVANAHQHYDAKDAADLQNPTV